MSSHLTFSFIFINAYLIFSTNAYPCCDKFGSRGSTDCKCSDQTGGVGTCICKTSPNTRSSWFCKRDANIDSCECCLYGGGGNKGCGAGNGAAAPICTLYGTNLAGTGRYTCFSVLGTNNDSFCYNATVFSVASSCTSGPDHICSDGKCYSQSGCPTGLFLMTNNTCSCGSQCSGTSNSTLQCQPETPSCTYGSDKICSDGRCYKAASQCPSNTTLVSNNTCKCASACSGSASSLQTSNCSLGSDKICSDGKCYPTATSCPTGTIQISSNTCTCTSCVIGTCPSSCTSSLQCSAPIPTCTSGPDHICSDGKCYSQSGCPMGTTEVSNGTCTCSSACNGTSDSYLKCFTPSPICGSGPDQTCSNGYCYPGTISCSSLGLTQTSNLSCLCSDNCTTTTSEFQCLITSCTSGPDHLCSDGFCYTGSQCPNGTTIVNNARCTCGNGCGGTCPNTCTSSLQCFTPLPSCGSGLDHTCSDGFCYTADIACESLNLTLANEYACMCSTNCTGETSSLQCFSLITTQETSSSTITTISTSYSPTESIQMTTTETFTTEDPCPTQVVYTQAEQEAILDARNEATAQAITQIQNNTKAAIAVLKVKYAVADSIKTTSGIVAIIFLSSLIALILLNDAIGLGCYLFGKDEKKEQLGNQTKPKKKEKKSKPIYLPKGGTQY